MKKGLEREGGEEEANFWTKPVKCLNFLIFTHCAYKLPINSCPPSWLLLLLLLMLLSSFYIRLLSHSFVQISKLFDHLLFYIHSLSSLFLWKVKECAPKYKNSYMTFTDQ